MSPLEEPQPAPPEDDDNRAVIEAFLSGQSETSLPPDHRAGFVAVIGRSNVGKSTLVNAIVGRKVAITSPKPQTTRRRALGILTRPDAQIMFTDTPGIHQPWQALNQFMVREAEAALADCDVIMFVTDLSRMPNREDYRVAELVQAARQPKVLAMNKADALKPQDAERHLEKHLALIQAAIPPLTPDAPPLGDAPPALPVSALRGDNLDKLVALLVERLPLGPRFFPAGQHTDQSQQFIAAELIREQALRFLRQEVPHVIAVAIEDWQVRKNGTVYIAATIYVERESQKAILIGRNGEMLRRIGTHARREIERELGAHVYLELWAKVREGWRKDSALVERFLRGIG
ncbi:MAG: GTPase Era [Anaerolineae bacterium]|nr:GTPase Era [Thermoflexales bacterium]MDW8052972.1 GTPase Era [Anaerolineae bacterium]